MRTGRGRVVGAAVVLAAAGLLAGCGPAKVLVAPKGTIGAVGAESQYADVLRQIGGRYVSVFSILNDPNTDPHTFEANPTVAQAVSRAQLVVQNGLGYDSFMNRIESATSNPHRKVVVVQHLLGLPDHTANPHLWYDPKTMPVVAAAMASDLAALQPAHATYFQARLTSFDAALRPWLAAIASFRAAHPRTPAATTEPVADDLLQAMGIDNLTPFRFQADVMNGVDPSPQDISLVDGLFAGRAVNVFCYNEQVVDSLTASIRQRAQAARIPVVGVYETMPTPGFDYQSWMMAETDAIERAVTTGVSTEYL